MDDKQLTLRRWLARAEHDLRTAETMLGQPDAPTDIVCFHCQQCAEKVFKAWLVNTETDFPKTHDLQRLLSLCVQGDATFRELEECAVSLADYAVETRYVDDWREIPPEEAAKALDWAKMAMDFVRCKLRLKPEE